MKNIRVMKAIKGNETVYAFDSLYARNLKDLGFKIKLVKLDYKTRREI